MGRLCQHLVRTARDHESGRLILAGTFASLTLAGSTVLSQIGFALSCGIALAAFVMAMFFSPSITALMGSRAWWPGHRGDDRHTQAAVRQDPGPVQIQYRR